MSQSATSVSAALAKRMRISEALEDLQVPLSPLFPGGKGGEVVHRSGSTSGSGASEGNRD